MSLNKGKCNPEGHFSARSVHGRAFTPPWRAGRVKNAQYFGLERRLRDSGEIERAWTTGTRAFDDVKVDHGGGDVGVAEEVLDGADVGAVL